MPFSLPSDTLSTCTQGTMYCMFEWANTVTSGMWTVFALLSFCVILLMATLRFGTPRAFGYASFVGAIGGIFFAILKLIPWSMASAFIVVGVIGLVVMKNSR